jgi:hypothetical protein
MKITISNVLEKEVTVSGQPLAREYVENVLLPSLMAQCGRNNDAKFGVIDAFHNGGLSLKAIPEDSLTYFETRRAQKAEREQLQREADEHAERCRVWTPRELAQAKADKEARAAAIREQGAKILAASRGNSSW